MWVAGAKGFPQDRWGDLEIPFNLTAESFRSRNADKAVKDNLQVTALLGHSWVGDVVL
jgi:hypothetical protein